VGGKEKLIPYVHAVLPPRFDQYIEAFGGSGAILLSLPRKEGRLEIYNDFNDNLVNLFRCVRDRPMALVQELEFLPLHARSDFELLKQIVAHETVAVGFQEQEMSIVHDNFSGRDAQELEQIILERTGMWDVRRAAAYYLLCRYSFSGTTTSFGVRSCNIRNFVSQINEASSRLAGVVVEHKDGAELVRHYGKETSLVYCDPPYFDAERSYTVVFSPEQHGLLHQALRESPAAVIVSYNDCAEIQNLYQDFFILGFDRPNAMSQTAGARYGELLMTNYDPRPLLTCGQVSLFDGGATPDTPEMNLLHVPSKPLKLLV
jgi:DNA adenine methylase